MKAGTLSAVVVIVGGFGIFAGCSADPGDNLVSDFSPTWDSVGRPDGGGGPEGDPDATWSGRLDTGAPPSDGHPVPSVEGGVPEGDDGGGVTPRDGQVPGGPDTGPVVPRDASVPERPDTGTIPQDTGIPCTERAVTCNIPDCNDHDGSDEAACRARGNRGGCNAEQLLAWCTRRVGDGWLWDEIHRRWVDERCAGSVTLSGNTFQCRDAVTCTSYRCVTPLVLVFTPGERVRYHRDDGRGEFDLSSSQDGTATRTDWPTAATPWLALDRDGDGRITSGRELFGSATVVSQGATARDGFVALSSLDTNRDGLVDARDPSFQKLVVWADEDGDRVSDPNELRPLSALGVLALEVRPTVATRCDARGNCEVERGGLSWRDAQGRLVRGSVVDVHLPSR